MVFRVEQIDRGVSVFGKGPVVAWSDYGNYDFRNHDF